MLRRAGGGQVSGPLRAGELALDPGLREVTLRGEPVALTFSEFELLEALMTNSDRVLSRYDLLRAIWGDTAYRDPRAIDVHVRHLREKLEANRTRPEIILTETGVGYRLKAD